MEYLFFSRNGGASVGPWASFNLSYHVGDDSGAVADNRTRVKQRLGVSRLISAHQVHGDQVYIDDGGGGDYEADGFDALVTDRPDTGLLIQQADCQAVLLHDPGQGVIAAVHCGWRGSVAGIIGKTLAVMTAVFDVVPASVNAYIGPSLGPCCAEFVNHRAELPASFMNVQVRPNYFDFWELSRQELVEAGVQQSHVHIERVCTSCSKDYFSYRRACRDGSGITGRHGSVISL